MKWLITGATGQLGKTLTTLLQATGAEVESHSRQSLDISDGSEVTAVIERSRPEILVNCAAWTDVDGAEKDTEGAIRVNATGAQNLAKATGSLGVRLIHISTDFVFGADNQEIYSEEDPHSPVNFYGTSKALGENLVALENPEAVILRASWLYSPYGKNFPKAIIRKLIMDESTLDVVSDQIGQPTSCLSLSNSIMAIAKTPHIHGVLHGSSSGSVSRYEFARRIATAIGFAPDRIRAVTSDSLNLPAKRPMNSVIGHGKHDYFGIERPDFWESDLELNVREIFKEVKLELK
jgi:dTDP-4-dehydrorhamnose reductase